MAVIRGNQNEENRIFLKLKIKRKIFSSQRNRYA